jgi:hypothetical protein
MLFMKIISRKISIISLLVTMLMAGCTKHTTFSGVVIDEVSKASVDNALIKYAWNPGTYPFNDDGYESVGTSGNDGHYEVEVKTDHDFGGYMIAEQETYWSPTSYGNDDYDSIHLFRKSWLSITLHDNPNIQYSGTLGYYFFRSYKGTDWLNIGQNVEVIEFDDALPVYDNEQLNFLLAGDMENDVVIGVGLTSHAFLDTTTVLIPAWGDTLKFDFDF